MHEIITLQLGNDANYVGTHFWNAQESYFSYDASRLSAIDPHVNFRAGRGTGGTDTFTPRVLIYDLKGGFGSMKMDALYEEEQREVYEVSTSLADTETAMKLLNNPEYHKFHTRKLWKRVNLWLSRKSMSDIGQISTGYSFIHAH